MIYRIFLEPFKSESPSSKYSQGHKTEHYSVFSISVKDPSSSPPTLEWLIPCPRLPLVNFELYRDIRRPPLQLISSICFSLFHKTERTSFIPSPIRPRLLFPLPLLRIREPCSLSPLFLSRGGDPAHLSLKTRVKSQLHSYFIAPHLILFWRKLCTIFSYKRVFFLRLANKFSALQHHQVPLLIWKRKPSSPQTPTLFRRLWATFVWGYNAIPKPNFVLT